MLQKIKFLRLSRNVAYRSAVPILFLGRYAFPYLLIKITLASLWFAQTLLLSGKISLSHSTHTLYFIAAALVFRFPWTKVAANSEHADIYLQDASSSDETSDNIIDDGDIPSLKAALHGSENRCKKIHNQFCKTTLPYSTSRDRIVTAASLPMTSRMLLALKSGLLASSQNRTLSQCNLESASRFFCLVLYPQCIESKYKRYSNAPPYYWFAH